MCALDGHNVNGLTAVLLGEDLLVIFDLRSRNLHGLDVRLLEHVLNALCRQLRGIDRDLFALLVVLQREDRAKVLQGCFR